jgi:dihydrofolate reductase
MTLTLIAAHDPNLVIGKDGELPWRYPEDLKHFKSVTLGNTIIMGRGVFEELNEKPLPGRKNIVLSRTRTYDNVDTYTSLESALENLNDEEIFIIGGGELYKQTLTKADKLIITEVHKEYEGDTYFPEYRDKIGSEWVESSREDLQDLSFIIYKRP